MHVRITTIDCNTDKPVKCFHFPQYRSMSGKMTVFVPVDDNDEPTDSWDDLLPDMETLLKTAIGMKGTGFIMCSESRYDVVSHHIYNTYYKCNHEGCGNVFLGSESEKKCPACGCKVLSVVSNLRAIVIKEQVVVPPSTATRVVRATKPHKKSEDSILDDVTKMMGRAFG